MQSGGTYSRADSNSGSESPPTFNFAPLVSDHISNLSFLNLENRPKLAH
jgi:hypothetical protein